MLLQPEGNVNVSTNFDDFVFLKLLAHLHCINLCFNTLLGP